MIEFIHMSSEGFEECVRPVSSQEFRRACGRFATGVAIATVVDAQGVPHGLTVSSFTSVSLAPPLVSICLGHAVSVLEYFRASDYFGVNVLTEDQRTLSEHFARKGHDRFQGVAWTPGKTGVPLIDDVLAAVECRVEQRIPVGDHDVLVGLMVASRVTENAPLLHFEGAYRKLHL